MFSLKTAGMVILVLSVALGGESYLLMAKSSQISHLREYQTALYDHDRKLAEQYNQLVTQIGELHAAARRHEAELQQELNVAQKHSIQMKRLLDEKEVAYQSLMKKWREVEAKINRDYDMDYLVDPIQKKRMLVLWPELSKLLKSAGQEKKATEFEAALNKGFQRPN